MLIILPRLIRSLQSRLKAQVAIRLVIPGRRQ
jgi:hypothetical protein